MLRSLLVFSFGLVASQNAVANDTTPSCASLRLNPPAEWAGQIDNINQLVMYLVVEDVFVYLRGGDSVFGAEYDSLKEIAFVTRNKKINPNVKVLVEKYDNLVNPKLVDEYVEHIAQVQESKPDFSSRNWENKEKYPSLYEYVGTRAGCEWKDALENPNSKAIAQALAVVTEADQKLTTANIGSFQATVNSCEVKGTVGTGNKFAEPKSWPDSRFLIVTVSFKNLDKEARLPVAGSAVVIQDGAELEYDSLESIPVEGYGIWFRSINPLLTMRTKLVYRIPKELEGSIYWTPGRNADKTRLWCSYLQRS